MNGNYLVLPKLGVVRWADNAFAPQGQTLLTYKSQGNKSDGFQDHRFTYAKEQRLRIKVKKYFVTKDFLKVAAWNIRGLGQKEPEMINDFKHQKVNIPLITERNKKLKNVI